jgi:hypothetical protein
MDVVDDPDEYALVVKAFASAMGVWGYVDGYVEWIDDRAVSIARSKLADLDGITPEIVRRMSIQSVHDGLRIIQSRETRDNWSDYRFKYFILIPIAGASWRVYVEFRLTDDDPGDPAIRIVSAHRAGV